MYPWLLALAITANAAPVEFLPARDLAQAPPSRAADWRVYGPLRVDWANWRLMDGSLVTRSRNEGGQSFYLSVNCKAVQINVTGATLAWKGWEKPQAGFEHRLITEACAAAPGSRN